MSLSSPFIHRPVGTTLLTVAIALAGILAFFMLPVSPLPQVDSPTISVSASLPGANPETMASAVATPLERQFGRIAGITEMTSSSGLGSANITLQFDLSRDINAAARDVQAAINAAASQLPANLPGKPTYRKVNPADAPIMILSMTSDIYDRGQMYDAASSILAQKLSQVEGVGQVNVGGSSLPAVRLEVNPTLLNSMGLTLADVRTAIGTFNVNRPKGQIDGERRLWDLSTTDQLRYAREYRPLIVAYRNGAPVRMEDIGTVNDSVENTQTGGLADGKPAVLLVISRQPGANIIQTVDNIRALIPQFQASIPAAMHLQIALDRTTTIRASVHDVEITLMTSICLVVLVVFFFLRDPRATLIPSVAVPISLLGTFAIMYLFDYSIDNLSLMALTVATGFVVDDAIVVIENITRHIEAGMKPKDAALLGSQEIGFTVLSISISLMAVFTPILLMGGYVGRLFREFAVTLSAAVGVSLIVSLTTTPMMCALLLKDKAHQRHGRLYNASEKMFTFILDVYERLLAWVLRHSFIMLAVTFITIGLTAVLFYYIPRDFFPQQDTGRLNGRIQADQNMSSQAMQKLMAQFVELTRQDPAVENVLAFIGGGPGGSSANTGSMFINLTPLNERKESADAVINRLRGRLGRVPGATVFLQGVQDIRTGGRAGNAQYQYTLVCDSFKDLSDWAPRLLDKMRTLPGLADVNSDQQNHGIQTLLTIDRDTASRLGLNASQIDDLLYDAFGQRQVSTMYTSLNQYHVVMEVDPRYAQDPNALKDIYARTATGAQIPLSAFAHYSDVATPLSVNHQSQFPATTITFNLLEHFPLGDAVDEIEAASREIGMPTTIRGTFAGTAQAYQDSIANEPVLIGFALLAVYIILGMLYESLIHPITILSTLPSAGLGALLGLVVTGTSFSLIALIGIFLLIGIVKKNAIIMIDFALEAERKEGKSPRDAIFQACLLRFRPITMTTMAALLGGLPLALGTGTGAELRRPLGIAIVGGLIVSQMLTLFTTPVIYLYLDRLRLWIAGHKRPHHPGPEVAPA